MALSLAGAGEKLGALALAAAATLLLGCDVVGRDIAKLADDATREAAAARLVRAVRDSPPARRRKLRFRVVHALMAAYRVDRGREQLISALCELGDADAVPIFAGALRDFERGGAYARSAHGSATALARLGARARGAAPALAWVLERSAQRRRRLRLPLRASALELRCVRALGRVGGAAARAALLELAARDRYREPRRLRLATLDALGRVGGEAAWVRVVRSLEDASLREAARRALCGGGAGARAAIEARAKAAQPSDGLALALADLGMRAQLRALAARSAGADPRLVVALALARMRLGSGAARRELVRRLAGAGAGADVAERARLIRMVQALGWYGGRDVVAGLRALLAQGGSDTLLRAQAKLALRRVASGAGVNDERTALAPRCAAKRACLRAAARERDPRRWRARERALLELGRLGDQVGLADAASSLDARSHPNVWRALVAAAEQQRGWAVGAAKTRFARALGALLRRANFPPQSRTARDTVTRSLHAKLPARLITRALCLAARLARA